MGSRAVAAGIVMALLLPARAIAADMCSGPCSFSIEFPQGGSITAEVGATLTFGPEGGLLALGDGGSMDLGEGGSFTTLEGGLANMSQGGSIVLGPGGSISFGTGGALATGTYGAAATDGVLDVLAGGGATITSDGAVHVGDLRTDGDVTISGGTITLGGGAVPINLSMADGASDADIDITGAGEVGVGAIASGGNVTVTATSVILDGASVVADGSGGSIGVLDPGLVASSGSITFDASVLATSGNISLSGLTLPGFSPGLGAVSTPQQLVPSSEGSSGGSMGLSGMLLIGLVVLGRRRR